MVHIGEGGTQKVARWREFLMPFNFDVEHIEGSKNIVADGFSRLCVFDESINSANFDDHEVLASFDNSHSVPAFLSRACSSFLSTMSEEQISDPNFIIPVDVKHRIAKIHNTVNGHFGVDETHRRLRDKGYNSKKLRDYIRVFIKRCPYCQLTNEKSIKIVTQPFVTSTLQPMHRLNIDTIGPLDVSQHGFQYILVIIDTFSRYITIWPIRSTTAIEAADTIIQHIGLFGIPKEILTDGGSQFSNDIINELVQILNSKLMVTIAYSKEENAIVERANKEVMRHLRAFIFDERIMSDWVKYIPLVQRIMNNKIHLSTGVSPASIITPGIDLDNSLIPSSSNLEEQEIRNSYIAKLVAQQNTAIEIAKKHLLDHEKDHIIDPDLPLTVFPIGSLVTLEYPKTAMGRRPPSKLKTLLQGPYKVSNIIGNEYFLEDLVDNRIKENVHVSRLRPYLEDVTDTARQTANKGKQVFDVEQILSHTGSFKRGHRKSLIFRVKWKNYEKITSEPWSGLRSNRMLHLYLIAIGKSDQIPDIYKANYSETSTISSFLEGGISLGGEV